MNLEQRINAYVRLGEILKMLGNSSAWTGYRSGLNEFEYQKFEEAISYASKKNSWFSEENIRQALLGIAFMLEKEKLEKWLSDYDQEKLNQPKEKRVAIIMAGNIPLVGFHDLLAVSIGGFKVLAKLSSQDDVLMAQLIKTIKNLHPEFAEKIEVSDGKLSNFDIVIATGSNNSSRYFEHYFSKYPHIIRKNRYSVAILSGDESLDDLKDLGKDIFNYYGMGCRNVSKIFVPEDYDLNKFFEAIYDYKDIINHNKYANNYDYHKALWLLNRDPILDNGFVLLKEDERMSSPVGTIFYERYKDEGEIRQRLDSLQEEIQCLVSEKDINFGNTQQPEVWDYADGVDTVEFLMKL